MIVVSDTSAISALLKIGRADLLSKLYGEVFVPQAVKNELLVAHPVIPGFFRVVPIANQNLFARLRAEIDGGEAEAIVLAMELKADNLLIDEVRGRRVAIREGVHIIGLLGVILECKVRGLIPSVKQIIGELEGKTYFRIADPLKTAILHEAGEL